MADERLQSNKIIVEIEHSNFFEPEDLYRFINLEGFDADWEELQLDDDDQLLLQIQIMAAPLQPPEIPGTGGIRRTPFSPPPRVGEKRKTIDVLYTVFPDFSVAVLAAAAPLGEMEELLPIDCAAISIIIAEMKEVLERGD
jgi:hypothetical protein